MEPSKHTNLLLSPEASFSPKQQESLEKSEAKMSWPRKIFLFIMSLILIFGVSIEMIAFKSTATAFPFSACFIICLFCGCHSILCWLILLYKIYILNKFDISILSTFPISKYIPLGILRTLSISIIFIAISREIPGSLLIILLQLSIPFSIIISRFISSISYKSISRAHWTAIILIFIGTIFGFLGSFLGHLGTNYIDYNNDNKPLNAWWYIPIVIVSCLIQSLFILYQEIKINKCQYLNLYPIELVNGWISLIQCLFTFLLSPILIYLGDPEILFWNDWYLFLHKGFLCLFDNSINNTIYCPNGTLYQPLLQFIIWTISSIIVLLLTEFIKYSISPLISRCCVLFGFLFAFIGFQIGFPSFIITNNNGDYFDECLLLAILCSMVGSFMLLIDFNPSRTNTLLDSIQFDELNYSKDIKSQLLLLQKQHHHLTMSQSQINIEHTDIINDDDDDHNHNINIKINNEEIDDFEDENDDNDDQNEHKTQYHYRSHSKSLTYDKTNNYVCYLLMEQQKDIIKQEYESKLAEYQQVERQRSHSFHEEFYSPKRNKKSKKSKKKNKRKKRNKNKNNKYYMNESQIEEYYRLLQEEHYRRQRQKDQLHHDNKYNNNDFETSQFQIMTATNPHFVK